MKMYDSVLQKVAKYEEKNGIYYTKTNGKTFKWLTAALCVPFLYLLAMNVFYLFSFGVFCYYEGFKPKVISSLSIVSVCTVALIVGFILLLKKFKISGLITQLSPLPLLLVGFGYYLKEPVVFSFKASFYYRHFVPIVLLFILLCVMLVIAIKERRHIKQSYTRVYQGIYEQYQAKHPDSLNDEDWEDFLNNYNGEI